MLPLSKADIRALHVALDNAYRSFALYDRILRAFGPAPPLERIREVEAGHIHVLEWLHRWYAVPLPERGVHLNVPRFADASHACAAAIQRERESVVLYRDLLDKAHEANVLGELRNLERASHDGHLPALHAWARQLGQHGHAHPAVDHVPVDDIRRERAASVSEHRRISRRSEWTTGRRRKARPPRSG